VAVVRRGPSGFEIIGEPVGVEWFAGTGADDAVFDYVRRAVGDRWPSDPADPSLPMAMLQLRRDCVMAKEALADVPSVNIPVSLPGVRGEVPLRREELDEMVTPRVLETMDALEQALALAGLDPLGLEHILLVGGGSRLPAVRRLLDERFAGVKVLDVPAVHAVALGAARYARRVAPATSTEPSGVDSTSIPPAPLAMAADPPLDASDGEPSPAPVHPGSPPTIQVEPAGAVAATAAAPGTGPVASATPVGASGGGRRAGGEQLLWGAVLVLFAVFAVAGPIKMLRGTDDPSEPGVVTMAPTRFAPATQTVPRGTTVVFTNNDTVPHTVTGLDDASVDSGTLQPGEEFSRVIDERFSFFCGIHPSMTATIEVEA
jgi:plastocyanin